MSALLSWILCAVAAEAAAGGGGDPEPTGLRSSEDARTTACAAPRLASSDILAGGWSRAELPGTLLPLEEGILWLFLKGDGGRGLRVGVGAESVECLQAPAEETEEKRRRWKGCGGLVGLGLKPWLLWA